MRTRLTHTIAVQAVLDVYLTACYLSAEINTASRGDWLGRLLQPVINQQGLDVLFYSHKEETLSLCHVLLSVCLHSSRQRGTNKDMTETHIQKMDWKVGMNAGPLGDQPKGERDKEMYVTLQSACREALLVSFVNIWRWSDGQDSRLSPVREHVPINSLCLFYWGQALPHQGF